jgi:hypothetical protein
MTTNYKKKTERTSTKEKGDHVEGAENKADG